ncbi:MAG: hypothetical protein NZ770_00765 [Candidatus Poseidoniaceae archaeon]|nr:hypothetical protein [Candidatus Poseidoniaceae archaeon]
MGRNVKDVKANLRNLTIKEEQLFQNMSQEVKRLEAQLRASIEERSESIEQTLKDLAKAKDAINAGLSSARKNFERLKRILGKSKADEKASKAVRDVARKLGDVRNTYLQFRRRAEEALNKPPTSVDMVEEFVQNVIRTASLWEDEARSIEGGFASSVDFSMPAEFAALESLVKGGGYEVLLAGSDRDPEAVKEFNDELEDLMNPEEKDDD